MNQVSGLRLVCLQQGIWPTQSRVVFCTGACPFFIPLSDQSRSNPNTCRFQQLRMYIQWQGAHLPRIQAHWVPSSIQQKSKRANKVENAEWITYLNKWKKITKLEYWRKSKWLWFWCLLSASLYRPCWDQRFMPPSLAVDVLFFWFWFFKTVFLSVALAALELTL